MFGKKSIATLLLVVTLLFAQAGSALAAPPSQETTPITGTIQSITTETDSNGVATVLVTVMDDQNVEQVYRLSVETAAELGLLVLDPETGEPVLDPETGAPIVDETQVGQTVEIDPTTVIPDETEAEEPVHPIAALLAAFFNEEGSVIDGYHDDGFGFGVIAQALWMSRNLNGDASLTGDILQAKESGDYSAFTLPDGSTPANWGQFKKAVLEKKNNLGVVVSGQAENDSTELTTQQGPGNGNGQGQGNGNGQGNNNKNKDKEKGKDK